MPPVPSDPGGRRAAEQRAAGRQPYQVTASRIAWQCPWFRVRQDDIITPDGRPAVYHTVTKENAVWIVPVTANGQVVMIYNYRYTVDAWCWEVPAGGIKPGMSPWETAVAELSEEIGGTAAAWQPITEFYVSNGFCDEIGYLYLASGVQLDHAPRHEATEVMTIHPLPAAQVLAMARAGDIRDGPSALALLLCAAYLAA